MSATTNEPVIYNGIYSIAFTNDANAKALNPNTSLVSPLGSNITPKTVNINPRPVNIKNATKFLPEVSQNIPSARQILNNINGPSNIVAQSNQVNDINLEKLNIDESVEKQDFEIKDYQGIISSPSLETELLDAGYVPINKIVVELPEENRTQYIKAINLKGQPVYVYVDVNGYTTAQNSDITLIQTDVASVIPYSIKTGAYNCASRDVCGIAFECGSDAVCVLTHGEDDLSPRETNFIFKDNNRNVARIESDPSIMNFPIVRLSEIRVNPSAVLENTDEVVRRLRNESYIAAISELMGTNQSIQDLNLAFNKFTMIQDDVAKKLNSTLTQLEEWNSFYLTHDRSDATTASKFRIVQHNLTIRNEAITTLLLLLKKVNDQKSYIDDITQQINEATVFAQREFVDIDKAYID